MTPNTMKHLINFDLILSSTEHAKIQNQVKQNSVVQGHVRAGTDKPLIKKIGHGFQPRF
jgi:hypothetical protein